MKRAACAAAVAVLLAGAARGDEKRTAGELAKDVVRLQNELVKQLNAVTDRASADRALPKVVMLRQSWRTAREELGMKPQKEVQAAYEAAAEAVGKPADVPAAWERVARLFPVGPDAPVLAEEARGEAAVRQAKAVLAACEAYYANPRSRNTYPTNLQDLLSPPFGGSSFLKNNTDLFDPWGVPFQYEVGKIRGKVNGTDAEIDWPYVWTERKIDGRVRLFGTKMPEKK